MIFVSDLQRKIIQLAKEEGRQEFKGDKRKAGPEIEKFISLFRQELGKSDQQFLDSSFGADWCAMFVYYVITTAGYPLDIKPFKEKKGTFALVGLWYEWAIHENKFKEITYDPKIGDLILYDKLLSNFELDHIGIIIENKPDYFITVEGNIENMTGVFKREKYNKMRGYICL